MTMKEYYKAGYKVLVGSMWGDYEVQDLDDVREYKDISKLEWVDEEKKVAYFYDTQDYDD